MIGLKRHTVQVVAHESQWASLFAAEAARLAGWIVEASVDIQHVGSTAVPGLPAKPILDVAVAVESANMIPDIVRRLAAQGYIDRGDSGRDGGYLLVRESGPDVRVVHVHVVERSDSQWTDYIRFRDLLRADSALRERYAALKLDLARRYPQDRRSYTAGKAEFIRGVLARGRTP